MGPKHRYPHGMWRKHGPANWKNACRLMSSKPVLAVDLDEVLGSFVDAMCVHLAAQGVNNTAADFFSYHFSDVWKCSEEECMCAYICIYTSLYVCTSMHVCTGMYVCVCMHACLLAWMYACMYVCVCMLACMYVCMYVLMLTWL